MRHQTDPLVNLANLSVGGVDLCALRQDCLPANNPVCQFIIQSAKVWTAIGHFVCLSESARVQSEATDPGLAPSLMNVRWSLGGWYCRD